MNTRKYFEVNINKNTGYQIMADSSLTMLREIYSLDAYTTKEDIFKISKLSLHLKREN